MEPAKVQDVKTADADTVKAEESNVKLDESTAAAASDTTDNGNAQTQPEAPVSSTAIEQDKVDETETSDSQAVKAESGVRVPDNAATASSADSDKVKATEASVSSTVIEQPRSRRRSRPISTLSRQK